MNNSINRRINILVEQFCDGNNSKFASAVNTSEANIRNYRGNTSPKLDVVVLICKVYNVSYEWILTGNGSMLRTDMPTMATPEAQNLQDRLLIRYERRIDLLNQEIGMLREQLAVSKAKQHAPEKSYEYSEPAIDDVAADGDNIDYKTQLKNKK